MSFHHDIASTLLRDTYIDREDGRHCVSLISKLDARSSREQHGNNNKRLLGSLLPFIHDYISILLTGAYASDCVDVYQDELINVVLFPKHITNCLSPLE